jgi:murein DD-endopeptidase MepM/ murein hydrolase activator NlpD
MKGMKNKGFYAILGVGLVAFVTLVSIYSYRSNVNSLDQDNGVNLNQSAEVAGSGDAAEIDNKAEVSDAADATGEQAENETASNQQEEAGSNGADSQETADNSKKNETADGNTGDSDRAAADSVTDEDATEPVDIGMEQAAGTIETAPEDLEDSEVIGVVSDSASADKTGEIIASLEYNGEATLIWPVEGEVIIPYSMETTVYYPTLNAYKCSSGMLIAGEEGTGVLSAYEGVVTAVTEDPDKGNMVTVNLGNGYSITYGQLTDVTVTKGATVSLGQKIGSIAAPTSHYTKEGSHVYIEMTKDGESINPTDYFRE